MSLSFFLEKAAFGNPNIGFYRYPFLSRKQYRGESKGFFDIQVV